MWHLKMTNKGGQFEDVGAFETLAAAAENIINREGYPVSGVFFEMLVETKPANEEAALDYFEHTAKRSGRLYVVKRVRH